jgi:hypothetical protein
MANPIGHPPRRRKSLFSAHANGVTEAMSRYYAECWPLLGFQIPTDLYNRLRKNKIPRSVFRASVMVASSPVPEIKELTPYSDLRAERRSIRARRTTSRAAWPATDAARGTKN